MMDFREINNMQSDELRFRLIKAESELEVLRREVEVLRGERNALFQKATGLALPEVKVVLQNNQQGKPIQQGNVTPPFLQNGNRPQISKPEQK